jgi:NADH:ubiquinone oxidoreductase subunit E
MPVTLIELYVAGLDQAVREALLETLWNELRISPGMVSADGDFELGVNQDPVDPQDAPMVKIGNQPHFRITPDKLRMLLRRRGTR